VWEKKVDVGSASETIRRFFLEGGEPMQQLIPLGNLTYTYDTAGQRTGMGGSFARTLLPTAVPNASYDANNRQTAWGSKALTYDINGNLTGDGTYTYVWNARDQLTQVKQGATVVSSYSYDAVGRRTSKTLGAATTSYLYDGVNAIKETTGSSTADLLSLGVDQVFSRSETGGTQSLLTDGLGSTLALGDGAGTLGTTYTYGAYGQTQSAGAASTNSTQYTGREQDAAGLYYYRARYYSTDLNRFISQDPIGLSGGLNWYGYVGGNPVNFSDPSGNCPWCITALIGGVLGFGTNAVSQYIANGQSFNNFDWRAAGISTAGGLVAGATGNFIAAAGLSLGKQIAANAVVGAAINSSASALNHNSLSTIARDALFGAAAGGIGTWAGAAVTGSAKSFVGLIAAKEVNNQNLSGYLLRNSNAIHGYKPPLSKAAMAATGFQVTGDAISNFLGNSTNFIPGDPSSVSTCP
jgi:RHS repeat-associated protein